MKDGTHKIPVLGVRRFLFDDGSQNEGLIGRFEFKSLGALVPKRLENSLLPLVGHAVDGNVGRAGIKFVGFRRKKAFRGTFGGPDGGE